MFFDMGGGREGGRIKYALFINEAMMLILVVQACLGQLERTGGCPTVAARLRVARELTTAELFSVFLPMVVVGRSVSPAVPGTGSRRPRHHSSSSSWRGSTLS